MTRDIKDLIVALDIGTSKVVAVVAEILPEGRFEVLGLGQHESSGMRKGVVVNIEATVIAIQRALEEAELMADCKIRDVYTGIAGSHIRSFNSSGMVAVRDKEVTATDVAGPASASCFDARIYCGWARGYSRADWDEWFAP
jgi:cell division protein FtsA